MQKELGMHVYVLHRSFEVDRKGLVLPRTVECHHKHHEGDWTPSESVHVDLTRLPVFLWKPEVHNGKVIKARSAS